jgi:hypothetical protein
MSEKKRWTPEEAKAAWMAKREQRAREAKEAQDKIEAARKEAEVAEQRRLKLEAEERTTPAERPNLREVPFVTVRTDLVPDNYNPMANYPKRTANRTDPELDPWGYYGSYERDVYEGENW